MVFSKFISCHDINKILKRLKIRNNFITLRLDIDNIACVVAKITELCFACLNRESHHKHRHNIITDKNTIENSAAVNIFADKTMQEVYTSCYL